MAGAKDLPTVEVRWEKAAVVGRVQERQGLVAAAVMELVEEATVAVEQVAAAMEAAAMVGAATEAGQREVEE